MELVFDSGAIPTGLWIALVATLGLKIAVLRRLGFDWVVVIIVVLGAALSIRYWSYTTPDERNYDGSSHIDYVHLIADQSRIPGATDCGVCEHPPLYYFLGAQWVRLTGPWLPFDISLQWLSLLLFFAFVVVSLSMLRDGLERPSSLWLAAALLSFWPTSIIHSIRVHNDALASPLILAAIYWLAKWDRHERGRDFGMALASSALAVLTKASGYAVALVVAAFALLRFFSVRDRKPAAAGRVALVAVVFASCGLLAVGFRDHKGADLLCSAILGPACRGRYVPPIPDSWARFLSFHPIDFLSHVGTVPTDPFLNRFLKSVLFGVMPLGEDFSATRATTVALVMSALLLALIAIGLWGALPGATGWLKRHRVYVAAGVSLLACLVAFRLRIPNEFHEDFRHIFSALPLIVLGYCRGLERTRSGLFATLGRAIALLMIACSVYFFTAGPRAPAPSEHQPDTTRPSAA